MKHEGHDPTVSRETPPTEETWSALERWLGLSLSGNQRLGLERYRAWLEEEAVGAGGIGPAEVGRLYDRHIFDSLAYLRGMPEQTDPGRGEPVRVVDVGSGVGLPGIPLAIAKPSWVVTLVDRSGRRTHLARRAARILALPNVEVRTADIGSLRERFDLVLFRASLPIEQATEAFLGLAAPSGVGVFGVSRLDHRPDIPPAPDGVAYELRSEGLEVLDSPSWLLRMRRTQTPRAE